MSETAGVHNTPISTLPPLAGKYKFIQPKPAQAQTVIPINAFIGYPMSLATPDEGPRKQCYSQEERRFIEEAGMANLGLVSVKSGDAASRAKRKRLWDKITLEFNSQPGFNKRNEKQLRKLWMNMRTEQNKRTTSLSPSEDVASRDGGADMDVTSRDGGADMDVTSRDGGADMDVTSREGHHYLDMEGASREGHYLDLDAASRDGHCDTDEPARKTHCPGVEATSSDGFGGTSRDSFAGTPRNGFAGTSTNGYGGASANGFGRTPANGFEGAPRDGSEATQEEQTYMADSSYCEPQDSKPPEELRAAGEGTPEVMAALTGIDWKPYPGGKHYPDISHSANHPSENQLERTLHTVKQELQTMKQKLPTVKQELHTVKQKLHTMKQELHTVKQELPTVKQELLTVKQELHTVKQELHTVKQDHHTVKQEPGGQEEDIRQLILQEHRARLKLTQLRTKEQEEHMEFAQERRRLELRVLREEVKLRRLRVEALGRGDAWS